MTTILNILIFTTYTLFYLEVFYAFTALLFSKPLIAALGARNGLLVGMGGYCVYVAAFLFAVIVPAGSWLQWTVFLIACAIGGIAGGLLWTAQGRYFARNSSKYSEAMIYASQRDQQIMQNQNQNNNDTNKGQNENDGLLDYTLGKINATFAGESKSNLEVLVYFSIYSILLLSCFMWNGILDNFIVLLSYIISLLSYHITIHIIIILISTLLKTYISPFLQAHLLCVI